jgi:DNA-binding NarL/FixJ family response regulator
MRPGGNGLPLSECNGSGQGFRVILFGGVDVSRHGLDPHFAVLSCQDVTSLEELAGHTTTSVVLVDLTLLSDSSRSELVKHIGRVNMPLAVAISDSTDDESCEQLLRMGFVGLLRRYESPETLGRAISAVVNGEMWFPRQTLSRVLKEFLIPNAHRLTTREMEILRLLDSGLNNQQIGDRLFIARETVRWHLRGLYSKLRLNGRRSAKQYVRRLSATGKAMPPKSAVSGDDRRRPRAAS